LFGGLRKRVGDARFLSGEIGKTSGSMRNSFGGTCDPFDGLRNRVGNSRNPFGGVRDPFGRTRNSFGEKRARSGGHRYPDPFSGTSWLTLGRMLCAASSRKIDRDKERGEHDCRSRPVGAKDCGAVDLVEGVVEQNAADHRADGPGQARAGTHYAHYAALFVVAGVL